MALSSALKGPWNPLRITGTSLPPPLLLLCKIIALALLGTRHFRIMPDPFLPFIPILDDFDPEIFRWTLRTTVVVSAVALLFNRWVRGNAMVLGGCLLLAVVSSRAYYGNNKTFCGLALVLAALSDPGRPAYLLRWQLSVVYFGAALNKLLDPDWQSGLFFDYWAGAKLHNPVYLEAARWLPPLTAGKIMCWGTIGAEFIAALGLLIPRLVPLALWVNILFQVGLLEFTGTTFTLFFYGMTAATLAFVSWPERLLVVTPEPSSAWGRRFFQLLDSDRLLDWRKSEPGRLQVTDRDRTYQGFAAVRRILLYSPAVWLIGTALLATAGTALYRRLLVAGVLVFFLPLWNWRSGRLTAAWISDTPVDPHSFPG